MVSEIPDPKNVRGTSVEHGLHVEEAGQYAPLEKKYPWRMVERKNIFKMLQKIPSSRTDTVRSFYFKMHHTIPKNIIMSLRSSSVTP